MNKLYLKQHLLNLYHSVFSNIIFKSIVAIWLFFEGIHIYLYLVFALVVMDVITGVAASVKRGESFKSKILNRGFIQKTFLYIIMILGVFALELIFKSIFPWEKFYFVFFVSVIISSYELISILENILSIAPNLLFIKSFIKLTKSINKKAVSTAENAIENFDGEEEKKDMKK